MRHLAWLVAGVLAWALAGDATEFRQVTSAPPGLDSGHGTPDWAPDDSRLAITSWVVDPFYPYELHSVIALVAADGGQWWEFLNQIIPGTWHGPLNDHPSWSPAGDRIAFAADQVYIGAVTDTALVPLGVHGGEPAWSPDGGTIAYQGFPGIWLAPVAGGAPVQLTAGPDRSPAWSRDGNWLAFASSRDGRSDVWIVSALGGEPRRITDDTAVDSDPSWSPDGELIAFASDRSGNADLWVVRVANGAMSQVTRDPAVDTAPAWSSDGTRIAFVSDRSGAPSIWVASDIRTVPTSPTTWTEVKGRYR